MITACIICATLLQSLDQTIANVALPYMQGSFSASYDEITWVLTTYITAAAIMTAPVGWLAARFGRKRLFVVCIISFTITSMLCGAAQTLEQIVAFRLLQGVSSAALVPLSQAILFDIYPDRAARLRDGGLGHGRDDRPDPRPDTRRLSHRDVQLALRVLHQPAVRPAGHARAAAVHARDRQRAPSALRLARLRRARHRHRRAADDAGSRQQPGLVHLARDHRSRPYSAACASTCSWCTWPGRRDR